MTSADLLDLPLDELCARASEVRDRHHGTRVTYSPKVFVPLTQLCRDKCGYCTFAQPPARLDAPYLMPDAVLDIAVAGRTMGVRTVMISNGYVQEEPLAESAKPLEREPVEVWVTSTRSPSGLP